MNVFLTTRHSVGKVKISSTPRETLQKIVNSAHFIFLYVNILFELFHSGFKTIKLASIPIKPRLCNKTHITLNSKELHFIWLESYVNQFIVKAFRWVH